MANPAVIVNNNLANGNPANAGTGGQSSCLALTPKRVIQITLIAIAATIYGAPLLQAMAGNAKLPENPSAFDNIKHKILTTISTIKPYQCASAIAGAAFTSEIIKGAVTAAKVAKYCLYDNRTIATGLLSSTFTGVSIKFGPGLAATYFPQFFGATPNP